MSFRLKTILGVALIEAFSLTLLLLALLGFMRDSHEVQMQRYSRATASNFASMTQDSLLAFDLARLQSFAIDLTDNSNIVYARIRSVDGLELASSGPAQLLQRPFKSDASLDSVDDGVFDVSATIEVVGHRYGSVEIGIAVDEIQAMFARTRLWGLSIASGEMLLVALFSLALGTYLTRQLAHLKTGAETLASGDLGYQVPVRGSDELAATATAFNLMSQSLRTRSAQLNAIFAISPDGFLSLDRDGWVRMVNPSMCRMLGVDANSLLDKDRDQLETLLRDISSPDEPFGSIGDVERMTTEGAPARGERYVFETADTPHRALQVTARRGDIPEVALLLHFRDVSHEREVERMKSEFLSTAAHELRTPMASVFGFSEILLNKQLDEAEQKEFLGIIHKQSALLVRIINELLDLARIESRAGKDLNKQRLLLGDLVQTTLGSFERSQQARFDVQLNHGEQAIYADRDKMQQALTNLVSNACKYSAPDQPVIVRSVLRNDADQVWLGLEVVDRGVGMSEIELDRCFERFWRADDSGRVPGTGLGMSVVKEIAELHRGRVELRSQPGQGTCATLWLPGVT
jgi:PAS domain S-box-containing protein